MNDMELIEKVTAIDDRAKSNTKRIDRLEARQDNLDGLVQAVAVMQNDQEYIKSDVGEIKTKVNDIAGKPAEKWENLVKTVIELLIAAALGYLLSRIGL
ncbi:MAG: hypothetical protein KBS59_00495 [Clostridiales bacterium]|nr:hypothetical protein [Clostridiales bacterium]